MIKAIIKRQQIVAMMHRMCTDQKISQYSANSGVTLLSSANGIRLKCPARSSPDCFF